MIKPRLLLHRKRLAFAKLHFRKKKLPVPSLFKKDTFMENLLSWEKSEGETDFEAFLSGLETVLPWKLVACSVMAPSSPVLPQAHSHRWPWQAAPGSSLDQVMMKSMFLC